MYLKQDETGIPDDVVRWIAHYARKHFWRMPPWMDLDDIIQDGVELVLKCRARYGYDLEPKHFKSLVMRAFSNRIIDLSNQKTRTTEDLSEVAIDGISGDDPFFEASLALAPKTIKAVLAVIESQMGGVESAGVPRRLSDTPLEVFGKLTNEVLCSLVGTDPNKIDLVYCVKSYLGVVCEGDSI